VNLRGQEEDSGLHSRLKLSVAYTKTKIMDLSYELLKRRESAPSGEQPERDRWRERVRGDGELPGLFIRHITYSPNVPRYF